MFSPPPRKSLSDEELSAAIGAPHSDETGILAAMELLETQTRLRERDLRDRTDWEDSMLRLGSKEALRALDNARRVDGGLDPIPFEPEPLPEPLPEPVVVPQRVEVPEPVVVPEPLPEPVPEPLVAPEPAVTQAETPDIAANLNALYGAPAATDFDELLAQTGSTEFESQNGSPAAPILGSAEEMVTEFEEDHLIAPLVSPVPGLAVSAVAEPEDEERSLSAWAASTPWLVAFGGMASVALSVVAISFSKADVLNTVIGICIGLLLAGCVLGVGAVAAKRGGSQLLLSSRAAFGVATNYAPAIVITIIRFAALVFVLTAGIIAAFGFLSSWVSTESLSLSLSGFDLAIPYSALLATAMFVPVLILGLLPSGARRVVVSILAILNLAGSLAFIIFSAASSSDLGGVFTKDPGFDLATVAKLAGLTFAAVVLLWAPFASDFARPSKASSSNFRVFAVTWLLVAGLPILLVGVSSFFLASRLTPNGLLNSDYATTFLGFSTWQVMATAALLFVSIGSVALLQATSIRDGLVAINLRQRRLWFVLILLASTAVAAWMGNRLGLPGLAYNIEGYLVALSIPVLAWVGIITSDVLLRRINYHTVSLRRGYGFYRNLTWFNLVGWLVAISVGYGLERSPLQEFSWLGYLLSPFAIPQALEQLHLGFWAAFLLAALFPVIFGVRHIKKQESEIGAIEARRLDLNSVHGI